MPQTLLLILTTLMPVTIVTILMFFSLKNIKTQPKTFKPATLTKQEIFKLVQQAEKDWADAFLNQKMK